MSAVAAGPSWTHALRKDGPEHSHAIAASAEVAYAVESVVLDSFTVPV